MVLIIFSLCSKKYDTNLYLVSCLPAVSIPVELSMASQTYDPGDTVSLISGKHYSWTCSVEGVAEPAKIKWTITDKSFASDSIDQTDTVKNQLWSSLSRLSLIADWSLHQESLWCNASVAVSKAASYVLIDIIGM